MRHILVRHEAGAAFAAGGYARTSGRVGVCCATSGPGATNLVTGLVDAMMDSIPVVAITGQRAHAADGHRRFSRSRRLRDHAVHDQGLDPDHRSDAALHQGARSVRARAQRPAGSGAGRHSDRRAQSAVRAGTESAAQGERRQAGRDPRIGARRGGRDSQRAPSGGDRRRRRARAARGQGVSRVVRAARAAAHDHDLRTRRVRSERRPRPRDARHARHESVEPHRAQRRRRAGVRHALRRPRHRPPRPLRASTATIVHNDIDASEFNKIIPTKTCCTAIRPTRSRRSSPS
jgi:hypothetical protein